MTVKDVLGMSFGNLWRMKIRSLLTISGVVIGIMALSSLLSFGVGMQKTISKQFQSMGLFTSLQVIPADLEKKLTGGKVDSTTSPALDDSAITVISGIPGVLSVYPEDAFQAVVECDSQDANATAHSLPASLAHGEGWSKMKAGHFFTSDSAEEVIIQTTLAKTLGFDVPDSILGREIILVTPRLNRMAIMRTFMRETSEDYMKRFPMLRSRLPKDFIEQAEKRFFAGEEGNSLFSESRRKFTVIGVTDFSGGTQQTHHNLYLPRHTAKTVEHLSFRSSFDLLDQLKKDSKDYSSLTVKMKSMRDFDAVRDSIEARGFHTFSLADQFEQMKKAFLIFDAMLGAIGLLALTVASLGIANTMVMSITERYREIGIMKSLGADDRQIRLLFLAESGAVGFLGGVFGLIGGWVLTRIASVILKIWMEKQGETGVDLFEMPFWLMLLSVAFGVGVSLLAGAFPARRAAKVDPVQSLRHD